MTKLTNEFKQELIRDRQKVASKRWYNGNKTIVSQKNFMNKHGSLKRRCLWCDCDISHETPRHRKFCGTLHARLHEKKRKKQWRTRMMLNKN